jgi:hypothetical protein
MAARLRTRGDGQSRVDPLHATLQSVPERTQHKRNRTNFLVEDEADLWVSLIVRNSKYPPYQTQTRLVGAFADFARQIIRHEMEGLKKP